MIAVDAGTRRLALALLLVMQTAFFVALMHRPLAVEADNVRYEIAGYNLARGHGLSLPAAEADDADVRGWVCTRHPSACPADTTYPVAIYAPGYSVFIAGVYALAGRSLPALVAAQLVLLWLLFVLFERVAARMLERAGYLFAMAVAATYPFLAAQASRVMSDHLQAVLLFGAIAAHLVMRPGAARGALFGLLMAAATLVRPYSMFVFPVLVVWPSVWRAARGGRRERLVALALFLLPFVAWTGRNAYWYGRFIPFSTASTGTSLYHTTLEFDGDKSYEEGAEQRYYEELGKRYGDPLSWRGSRLLGQEALRRIRARPAKMLERMLIHVPKGWLSLGASGHGLSRAWPILLVYLGGLWLLGVAGFVVAWRDARWHAVMLTIASYYMMLVPLPAEGRRTLPLRLPHLLLAAVAAQAAWRWWRAPRLSR